MLTFTRRAANEMRSRVTKLTEDVPDPRGIGLKACGTYHSVASMLIRKRPEVFGVRANNFTILDQSDCTSLWKSALRGAGVTSGEGGWTPRKFNGVVSHAINSFTDPAAVVAARFGKTGNADVAVRALRNYEGLKLSANTLDYDDLMLRWWKGMARDPAFTAQLRGAWTHCMVDEFQDNNPLQAKILETLDPKHLLVVGDENQGIYRFRGATPELMREYERNTPDCEVIMLEQNYRSAQVILDLANSVMARDGSRLNLQSSDPTKEGYIRCEQYSNQMAEGEAAADWISDRLADGVPACEIAVLSRTSRALAATEADLSRMDIPFKKYGGVAIADTQEVKEFTSFLRVLHNPRDRLSWINALSQFPKMGEAGATKFIEQYPDGNVPELDWPDKVRPMHEWLEVMKKQTNFAETATFLLEKIEPLIRRNHQEDADRRLQNLREVVTSARHTGMTLSGFLDSYATEKLEVDGHPDNAVVLSTIHSSKGLEFTHLWLVGTGDKQMPSPRSESEEDIREENRLMYVAITRARTELICSYPIQVQGEYGGQLPSRLLPVEREDWQVARDRSFYAQVR